MFKIYTRTVPMCPWCIKAKELMKKKAWNFEEFVVGIHISRDDFVEKCWPNTLNPVPTVPQIFIDDHLIGGYEDLLKWSLVTNYKQEKKVNNAPNSERPAPEPIVA